MLSVHSGVRPWLSQVCTKDVSITRLFRMPTARKPLQWLSRYLYIFDNLARTIVITAKDVDIFFDASEYPKFLWSPTPYCIDFYWTLQMCGRHSFEIPGLILRLETVMFYLFWYGFILRHCGYLLYYRMAGWLINNKLAVTWKKAFFTLSRYYPEICLRY